jgi:L-lactate dehydrogenase complex protein LldE
VRASLFVTCLGDVYFPDAAVDAVRLLRSLGVDVDFPPAQSCCGQPAYNAGQWPLAARMACHTLSALEGAEDVVLPSGSCAAMISKHYAELLHEGAPDARADGAPRVWELSQFVVKRLGRTSLGRGLEGLRVAVHHGCHALRDLGVHAEAELLLREAGAEVVEWETARECCGFGGLFSVKLPHVSVAMADRKLDTLPAVDVLTSSDPGCLLQLRGRIERRGGGPHVTPLASLLWRAMQPAGAAALS